MNAIDDTKTEQPPRRDNRAGAQKSTRPRTGLATERNEPNPTNEHPSAPGAGSSSELALCHSPLTTVPNEPIPTNEHPASDTSSSLATGHWPLTTAFAARPSRLTTLRNEPIPTNEHTSPSSRWKAGAAIIAISRLEDPRALTELMRVGVRDFVAAPIKKSKFQDAVRRVLDRHSDIAFESVPDPVVAFWPSRGGSGTSTLACNVSRSLSQQHGSQVLLADLDVCAGLSRYMFEMNATCSLAELAALGQMPDQYNWGRCVITFGNLHVLYGGKQDARAPFTPQYIRELFRYASSRFSSILVDLPGTLDGYALEVLRSARRILLVTTAEVPAIGLAREKLEYLSGMGLHTRTGVLLTIGPGGAAPSLSDLQAYLGAPIDAVFDFSEKKIRQHLSEGSLVDPRTALGRQITEFAQELSMLVQAG